MTTTALNYSLYRGGGRFTIATVCEIEVDQY